MTACGCTLRAASKAAETRAATQGLGRLLVSCDLLRSAAHNVHEDRNSVSVRDGRDKELPLEPAEWVLGAETIVTPCGTVQAVWLTHRWESVPSCAQGQPRCGQIPSRVSEIGAAPVRYDSR